MSLPLNQIVCGDALEVLKGFPEESIDCLVTDPPYGLSFMGKDWDKAVPSVEVWRESLRVLKSGAFAFVMCSPRLDCLSQMAVRLQQAGFNIGFTPIYWTFASGFPKSENISLQIDKRACREELRSKLGRESTKEEFNEAWKKYRTLLGYYQIPFDSEAGNAGKQYSDMPIDGNIYADPHRDTRKATITEPKTEAAKVLDGSYGGFQVKPSVEVIIVAQKPLKHRTYVDQALDWVGQRMTILRDIEMELHKQGVESVEWEPV